MNPAFTSLLWKIGCGIVLAVGLFSVAKAYRNHVYQSGYDTAVNERAARDLVAVTTRNTENVATAVKQGETNVAITKAKNEELAPVVRRIAVDRVRVGAGICGPAAPAKAESPARSDAGNSPGRMVSERTEADIRKLMLDVEEDLATGRACQAFIRENGFVP